MSDGLTLYCIRKLQKAIISESNPISPFVAVKRVEFMVSANVL